MKKLLLLSVLLTGCASTPYSKEEYLECKSINDAIYQGQTDLEEPAYCFKYKNNRIVHDHNKAI